MVSVELESAGRERKYSHAVLNLLFVQRLDRANLIHSALKTKLCCMRRKYWYCVLQKT